MRTPKLCMLLVAALLGGCAFPLKIPEVYREASQMPYNGSMRSTWWGMLKADPNYYVVSVEDTLLYIYGVAAYSTVILPPSP